MSSPGIRRSRGPAALLSGLLAAVLAHPAVAQQTNFVSVVQLGTSTVESRPLNIRSDLLLASDGNFYAASYAGGSNGGGAVARIAPDGTMTVLGTLNGNDGIGAQSYARLLQATDGNFYGTTYLGGGNGRGTVFKVTPDGTLSTLYAFPSGKHQPMLPYAGVVQAADGNLYGSTMRGGANDAGTIFRLTLAGEMTVLHEFSGNDGRNPEGTLIVGSDGELYGTTLIGGEKDRGTIFRISTGGTFTQLYSFPALGKFNSQSVAVNETGANPRAALVQASDGNFYGTAYQGGANGYGTVFRLTPAGEVSVMHDFAGAPRDGGFPLSGLTEGDPGVLYGTTEQGGHVNAGSGYRLTTDGQFTLLHSFSGGVADGRGPHGTLVPLNGELYGASYTDGSYGYGAVFKLQLPQDGELPVQISVSPTQVEFPASATLTWSAASAASCTASGAWSDTIGTSGTQVVTPSVAGYYTYLLSCTDDAGVVRSALAGLVVTAQEAEAVDGGTGGGTVSPWLLLLACGLLSIRLKKPRGNW